VQAATKEFYLLGVLGRLNGDCRLLSGYRPPNLPEFALRATGDISAEGFCMRKQQRPFKEKPHDDDDDGAKISQDGS